ncbi:MAG: MgtC/SapB family protein [Ardenticatenaceae bacterium]|nr:MgtC/SapB family protein [Anaerolineales bacterium]MCB8921699.1 MgtC/SapB family protein [Ardenticatenaceae bacterium]MCB8990782.1 MgtC/SapB family protein [Ardenticatenaceae bacterium]MCB9003269.1 MgtC/SapB family protein [Ardenticatenaceae bacterium]
MEQHTLFYRFGVALVIGILVGLQREHSYDVSDKPDQKTAAGVRTFALLSLTGCTAAYLAHLLAFPWVYIGIILPVGGLIAISYFTTAWRGEMGMTTEVAALLIILVGSLCFWDEMELAVALGVITMALLSLKFELHRFAERITREDVLATLKFAIITAVILPVLPNHSFGPPPFDVLNPYKIWLMVVLISGISFLGYVMIKIVGSQRGIGLTGILGGLASSTATTLSFAQRSHSDGRLAKPFALAITLAWTVMFVRILVEVGAVYRPLLSVVWIPIAAAAGAGLAYGAYLYFAPHGGEAGEVNVSNPFELGPAITFGLIYGVILLASRAAELYFGSTGLYLSSILSGLADVDAITLSVTELSSNGTLDMHTASRAIVLAAMSNTAVKGGIVLTSGSPTLRRVFLPGFALILIVGVTVAFLL